MKLLVKFFDIMNLFRLVKYDPIFKVGFKGDKKKFAGAVDNLAKRQFYGPVKSLIVSFLCLTQ